ncbi:MAG: prephenate dehydratase domain-containing protein [Coriobacteriaceae bacterium]|nr:prephenate dehydratase domain-containing protein [Coriobacteriaceae bacterium]
MDLSEVRTRIDDIDSQLLDLFSQRMELAKDVAASKMQTGKAIFDPAREREKLAEVAAKAPQGLENQAIALFSLLMSMNKASQLQIINRARENGVSRTVRDSLVPLDQAFPRIASVCCQGVEGAYSQIAACKLFDVPSISFEPSFEGVFRAVTEGRCDFGVLPIENSTAGSVNAVYDLLGAYGCSIVRSLRLKIEHNLMAAPGVRLSDVREVISHSQAINQCAHYLEKLGVVTTVCENTARAAEMVATSDRRDVAALSSIACAGLYGLNVLDHNVQDSDANYTRFVVIAREPAIYPGADRSSIQITLKSEPGALYRVLERIYALNIDLVKLESRPVPGSDFEFTFYFDLACPAVDPAFSALLDSLDDVCMSFRYFGSYSEVI